MGAGDYRADFGEGRQRNFQVSRAAFDSIARWAGALHECERPRLFSAGLVRAKLSLAVPYQQPRRHCLERFLLYKLVTLSAR